MPHVPDASQAFILSRITSRDMMLRLFVNEIQEGSNVIAADFLEASGFDYAPILLSPGVWKLEMDDGISIRYPLREWKFTGGLGNVWGYYLTDQETGTLLWMARFHPVDPYRILTPGSRVQVTPILRF